MSVVVGLRSVGGASPGPDASRAAGPAGYRRGPWCSFPAWGLEAPEAGGVGACTGAEMRGHQGKVLDLVISQEINRLKGARWHAASFVEDDLPGRLSRRRALRPVPRDPTRHGPTRCLGSPDRSLSGGGAWPLRRSCLEAPPRLGARGAGLPFGPTPPVSPMVRRHLTLVSLRRLDVSSDTDGRPTLSGRTVCGPRSGSRRPGRDGQRPG